MGRSERPLDPEAGPLQRFAWELRQLREDAGRPTYRQLARRAHFSYTALAGATKGERLPSLEVTLAYVAACGGDREVWEARWRAAEDACGRAAAKRDQDGENDLSDYDQHRCPYPGLASFGADDADLFFGRSAVSADLVRAVEESRLVAVFGASGSGKSSLLNAGLLPAMEGARAIVLTPGEDPLGSLARAVAKETGADSGELQAALDDDPAELDIAIGSMLARGPRNGRALLIVDQFEELFTLCADRARRERFLDALTDLAAAPEAQATLVLSVRADFYGHCSEHAGLVGALRTGVHIPIGPVSQRELRDIIVKPAARVGLDIDPDLVATVLAEAAGEPGALPLVAHALRETWSRREDGRLRLAGYQAGGGVRGAIAQSAERVYGQFGTVRRDIAHGIFLRLTTLGEGTADSRRRISRAELTGVDEADVVDDVLQRLAEARLLVLDDDSVDIAHEALISAWPRLRRWLADDRERLTLHRRLTGDAADWERHDRDPEYLYGEARLVSWDGRELTRLNELEHQFLSASRDRSAHKRKARRRRRRLTTGGLGLVAAVVSVLSIVAMTQATEARDERDRAYSRQLAASARDQLDRDPELALLLAREAYQAEKSDEAENVLRQATVDSRLRAATIVGKSILFGVAFRPGGRQLVTTAADGAVRLWNWDGRSISPAASPALAGHKDETWSPAFSPNGNLLATGGADGTILVQDLTGTRRPLMLKGHTRLVKRVVFSPDGRRLASTGDDRTVRIWTLGSKPHGRVLGRHQVKAWGVAFSPDGRKLASSGTDGAVIWDLQGKDPKVSLRENPGDQRDTGDITFGSTGKLAGTGENGTVRVWKSAGDRSPLGLRGHDGSSTSVTLSPDESRVATTGYDGTARIWNTTDGTGHVVLRSPGSPQDASFSPDGRYLATAGDDGRLRIWDAEFSSDAMTFSGHKGAAQKVLSSPDGRIASASEDGTVRIWNPADRAEPLVLRAGTPLQALAMSRDGRRVAAGSLENGTVRVWNLTGDTKPVVLRGHRGWLQGLAFTPDGRRIASAGGDGTIMLRDIDGRGEPVVLRSNAGFVQGLAFSPDGAWLAATRHAGTVQLWSTATRRIVRELPHKSGPVAVTFDRAGRWVLSGGFDGAMRRWPMTGASEPKVFTGHLGTVWSVAFSPQGDRLASAGADGTLRLWNAEGTGQPLVFQGLGASVEFVDFTPDGRRLVTAHDDGTVRLWRCSVCAPIEAVLKLSEQRVTRELTKEERRAHLRRPNDS